MRERGGAAVVAARPNGEELRNVNRVVLFYSMTFR
jgi:hypothetical protein